MHRRRYLKLCGAGSLGAVSGCLGEGTSGGTSDGSGAGGESQTAGLEPTGQASPPVSLTDVDLPVARDALEYRLPRDEIPAIVDPVFDTDWRGVTTDDPDTHTRLPEFAPVIGVARDGRARAYPLRILDWHEVVNDDFAGPILVTYCVLCGSAVVAERTADGEPTQFGVSGALWRGDLVMYDDATGSLWSQLLATAIRGDLTGHRLTLVESSLTTWGEWQETHPDTQVLLPPPHSDSVRGRTVTYDYFRPKYSYGGQDQLVGYDSRDGGLTRRTLVVGVTTDGVARAYPFPVVTDEDVINDEVGDLPVVVAAAPDGTLAAFDRRVDGGVLTFSGADDRTIRANGSRWERTTGRAIDGPHEGDSLDRANDLPPMFWHGWSNFNPGTEVYGIEGDPEESATEP